MKLTPANARDAKPGDLLSDHAVAGLELRCGAESKSWYLYYTTRDGMRRRPKLGTFPDMTLSAARNVARTLKEQVAKGEDPSAEWTARREAPNVSELIDRYLKEWVDVKNGTEWATATRRYARMIRLGLGNMKVADVRRYDVDAFLLDVLARKYTRIVKRKDGTPRREPVSAPIAMNRCRSVISKMFYYAEELGWIAYDFRPGAKIHTNPARHAERSVERKRKVIATPDMLPRLAAALNKIETEYGETTSEGIRARRQVACIWTIFLTGARVGEIVKAMDTELQPDGLVKTGHKTVRHIGDKTIPLPNRVREMLARLPKCDSGRLFSRIGMRHVWARIRKEAECPGLQLRDARRTFASFAASMGVKLEDISDLFGHTDVAMTHENYKFLFQTRKQQIVDQVADTILDIAEGKRIS
jgi:integrase